MGTQPPPPKGAEPPPQFFRVEVENFEIGPEVWALSVLANFVAIEQQNNFDENQK